MNTPRNVDLNQGQVADSPPIVDDPEINDLLVEVANLLSKRLGGTQEILAAEQLAGSGGALVLRIKLAPTPYFDERTAVVKYMQASESQVDDYLMLREIVAYQFTTSLHREARPGPYLIAYDMERRILVISDSGDGDTFAEMLDSAVPGLRIEILRSLGEAIGKMHAATALQEENFDILTRRMQKKYPQLVEEYEYSRQMIGDSIITGLEILHHYGITISPVVADFATDAKRRLLHGQHRAFTPFGISPDNIIVADKPQFLDYESAGFFDCAFDLAGVVGGFPQYLFSSQISDDEADVFIDAWVPEVAKIWPNVQNRERLHARILTALIGWALLSISTLSWQLSSLLPLLGHTSSETGLADNTKLLDLHGLSAVEVAELFTSQGVDIFAVGGSQLQAKATDDPEVADAKKLYRLAQIELTETFEALENFAQRDGDTRFPVVASFASEVLDKLRALRNG